MKDSWVEIKDKVFLVTGANGYIGSTLIRYLLDNQVAKVIGVVRDASKGETLVGRLRDSRFSYIARDFASKDITFEGCLRGVDYVAHCAAIKTICECEKDSERALRVNVNASQALYDACIVEHVKGIVSLSTDKACEPVSVMGRTKSLMEDTSMRASARARSQGEDIVINIVRFGNVLNTPLSVAPKFRALADNNATITVTSEDMRKFIMTVDECVQLIIRAFDEPSGSVVVKKLRSYSVMQLAIIIKQKYNSQSDIVVTKPSRGERMFEVMMTESEMAKSREADGYIVFHNDNSEINGRVALRSDCCEMITNDELYKLI